jgi:hypothetical protein
MAGSAGDFMTKPNLTTGIKGLSYNKNKRAWVVYEYRQGERICFGCRRNFEKAKALHAAKIKTP